MKCPVCGEGVPDGLMCPKCVGACRRELRTIRDLWPEMTMPGASRSALDGGSRSPDRSPLPVNLAASDDSDEVRTRLVGLVDMLDMGDSAGMADWPPVWCEWLIERAPRIATHAASADIRAEIRMCSRLVLRHAGRGRSETWYCGACKVCGAGLYATPGSASVLCHACHLAGIKPEPIDVTRRRETLLKSAEDALVTRDEVLTAVPKMFGVTINRGTLASWISRGRLSERAGKVRVGDVLDLAHGVARRGA